MPLAVTGIELPVREPRIAAQLYADMTGSEAGDDSTTVPGGGVLRVARAPEPVQPGFRGWTLSAVFAGPGDVDAAVDRALSTGARLIRPAKKSFFGAYLGVVEMPDGAIWQYSSSGKGRSGNAQDPTEVGVLLGVRDPKRSAAFYADLGMRIDRDYGSKYTDFVQQPGEFRLGFLPAAGLAKDAGVDAAGDGVRDIVLEYAASSADDARALLDAVVRHGGGVDAEPAKIGEGATVAFTDPDGVRWRVGIADGPDA